MTKRMLIDATHDEETRVAVVDGRKLVEFDYESKFRKPLKGSIFLAKVTRVEPSLQAAFVNFGGNRHGFLPFSEIHPDYFRIPIADREALLAEQQAMIEEQEAAEREREQRDREREERNQRGEEPSDGQAQQDENVEYLEREDDAVEEIGGGDVAAKASDTAPALDTREDENIADDFQPLEEIQDEEQPHDEGSDDASEEDSGEQVQQDGEASEEGDAQQAEGGEGQGNRERGGRGGRDRGGRGGGRGRRGRGRHRMAHRSNRVEKFGGEDSEGRGGEDRFRFNLRRKYKIQEVIKRGQIMLVQVSKEERGNKGAAVSTYLSLPGRYCVLMPNSPRAGGVSRKIANFQDRARMKEIMQEIEVPQGMSVIVRTAGVSREKSEINRDLDYLMRLWDNIRELTLQSSAPAKVYEEADLIKRAVRDLYGKDIDQIVVAGDEGYKNAKNFMGMMIPSHVDNVIEHTDDVPLFTQYRVEDQIAEIGETRVTLPSGGYLIINQTEALVAVDVNSGKATKERHIEETALKTNMEAASEVARQLRLRDLGGLVVIDFIDMEDRRNNAKVERRVREALSTDRARIQMSRISSFGLMELSRQRLNPSLTESQFEICPHCAGLGRIRTADAMAILVLRAIEAEGIKGRGGQTIVHVPNDVAVYILNNKRKNVTQIEARYDMSITIRVDETVGASTFKLETQKGAGQPSVVTTHSANERHDSGEAANDEGHDHSDDSHDSDEGGEDSFKPRERSDRGGRGERDGGREGGGRRRGRRGGRNRGRREFRDRDDRAPQNAGQSQEQDESVGNQRVVETFDEGDEFEDAAAHQAIHDQIVDKREKGEFGPSRGAPRGDRGPRNEEGGREGGRRRGRRGGRNRGGRGGRDRNEQRGDRPPQQEGNRSEGGNGGNNRPPRRENFDGDAQPQRFEQPQQERPQQREPQREAASAPPIQEARASAPQRQREPKEYENVNPEPSEKKRGWWNRLTE